MHDIDNQISRISGSNNYMEQLQKVTGNIYNVDMIMWKDKINVIKRSETNISKLFNALVTQNPGLKQHVDEFNMLSTNLDLEHKAFTIQVKKRKGKPAKEREIISTGYLPSELVKKDWFKKVKFIEKDINRFMSEMFVANAVDESKNNKDFMHYKYTDLENVYLKHPDLKEIQKCLGINVNNEPLFRSLLLIRRCCNDIINILLLPMYDVRKTIESHWSEIDRIFKSKAFQQTTREAGAGNLTPDDIINILHKFIIAKYRASITGNNKHYVKLLMDTVGNENISNIDGARFIEIMDAVDIDQFNKKDKVYQFASKAKEVMKRLANNEQLTPAAIEELSRMMTEDVVEDNNDKIDDREVNEAEQELDDVLDL